MRRVIAVDPPTATCAPDNIARRDADERSSDSVYVVNIDGFTDAAKAYYRREEDEPCDGMSEQLFSSATWRSREQPRRP
jgi:hypothetical protein